MVDAGIFDGSLGIISAISALKVLKITGKLQKLRRPIEVCGLLALLVSFVENFLVRCFA